MGRILNSDVGTVEVKGDMAEICAGTAAFLLEGSVDRTLFFGSVVWQPSDGTSARRWYFMVVGGDQTGEMRCDQLNAETEADTLALRSGVMDVLAKPPRAVCATSTTNWRWRKWPRPYGRAPGSRAFRHAIEANARNGERENSGMGEANDLRLRR